MKLTGEDERKGVNRIVKLLLCKDGQKKAVSRGDIFVAIKAEGVPAGAANVNALIEGARKKLKHVFGFELVEGSKSELYCDTTYSHSRDRDTKQTADLCLSSALAKPAIHAACLYLPLAPSSICSRSLSSIPASA